MHEYEPRTSKNQLWQISPKASFSHEHGHIVIGSEGFVWHTAIPIHCRWLTASMCYSMRPIIADMYRISHAHQGSIVDAGPRARPEAEGRGLRSRA